MPKTIRINTQIANSKSIFKSLQELGFPAVPEPLSCLPRHHRDNAANIIYIDDDFDDLLVIPAPIFGELKSERLLNDGSLILQVYR
jgi:hypothetical protein